MQVKGTWTHLRAASCAAVAFCGISGASSSRSSYGRSGRPWPNVFARLPDMMALPGWVDCACDGSGVCEMFWGLRCSSARKDAHRAPHQNLVIGLATTATAPLLLQPRHHWHFGIRWLAMWTRHVIHALYTRTRSPAVRQQKLWSICERPDGLDKSAIDVYRQVNQVKETFTHSTNYFRNRLGINCLMTPSTHPLGPVGIPLVSRKVKLSPALQNRGCPLSYVRCAMAQYSPVSNL